MLDFLSHPVRLANSIHRSGGRRRVSALVVGLLFALGSSLSAQPISTEPRLDIFPEPALALQPIQVVFSGFTVSCTGDPVLEEVVRQPGLVILELQDPGCPLLPPGGYEYRIVKEIAPPSIGMNSVEVREPGGALIATRDVEVTPLEQDELRVLPLRLRSRDTKPVRLRLTGNNGGCLVDLAAIDFEPNALAPAAGPTKIDIRLERSCLLDPPLNQPFELDVELGRLPPELYAVTARFEAAEASRTQLIEVYVDSEPPSLSISPTEPVDTDSIQVGITRPGQLLCDPQPDVSLTSTRIEVRVDSDCWGAPFDDSSTVFATVEERPAGRYLLILLERKTSVELDRRIVDVEPRGECVESITTLCLLRNRFRATALWRISDGTQGPGHAVLRHDGNSAASGTFWFFDPNSVEVDLKVLNGCNVNGHFWVFAAGLTDQAVVLQIEDTVTDRARTYGNALGVPFQAVTDIGALSCF